MCSEAGEKVPFGEDAFYEQIVVEDFRGYDFQKQRDSWREGTDFTFKAEFYAEQETQEPGELTPEEQEEELELDDMMGTNVVDTTADEIIVESVKPAE